MSRIRQSNGQAAVETVVCSAAVLAFTAFLLFLIYFCILKTNLQYASHEFLICRETSNPWICDRKFKKELESLVKFGDKPMVLARKASNRQVVDLRFKFQILSLTKVQWNYRDSIDLPLKVD